MARLCRRLDCLPLAIELAAARTRDYAPARAARLGAGLARARGRGGARPAVAPAHAALDDRLELPAARPRGAGAVRAPRRVRRRVHGARAPPRSAAPAARRSASLVGASLVHERARRRRRDAVVHARDRPRVRARAAGRDRRGRGLAPAPRRALRRRSRRRVEDEHPASRSGAAWRRLEAEQDNFRAALDWSRDAEPSWSSGSWARSRTSGRRATTCARGARGSTTRCAHAAAAPRAAAREGAGRSGARRAQPRRLRAHARRPPRRASSSSARSATSGGPRSRSTSSGSRSATSATSTAASSATRRTPRSRAGSATACGSRRRSTTSATACCGGASYDRARALFEEGLAVSRRDRPPHRRVGDARQPRPRRAARAAVRPTRSSSSAAPCSSTASSATRRA